MGGIPGIAVSGKQIVLLAVAGLLSVSGAIAIGILLFGDFGQTEGRRSIRTWPHTSVRVFPQPSTETEARSRLEAEADDRARALVERPAVAEHPPPFPVNHGRRRHTSGAVSCAGRKTPSVAGDAQAAVIREPPPSGQEQRLERQHHDRSTRPTRAVLACREAAPDAIEVDAVGDRFSL